MEFLRRRHDYYSQRLLSAFTQGRTDGSAWYQERISQDSPERTVVSSEPLTIHYRGTGAGSRITVAEIHNARGEPASFSCASLLHGLGAAWALIDQQEDTAEVRIAVPYLSGKGGRPIYLIKPLTPYQAGQLFVACFEGPGLSNGRVREILTDFRKESEQHTTLTPEQVWPLIVREAYRQEIEPTEPTSSQGLRRFRRRMRI